MADAMGAAINEYGTPDGLPDERGCVNLVEAFWERVHKDLSRVADPHCAATVLWIDRSSGFVAWCEISGAKPEAVRAALEKRHAKAFAAYRQ